MSHKHQGDRRPAIEQIFLLNAFTAGTGIAPHTMQMYLQRGRSLHGQAVRRAASTIARALAVHLRGFVIRYRCRREVMRTERELRRLDDWMLKDIGIVRADIPALARALGRPEPGPQAMSVREIQFTPVKGNEYRPDMAA